jgi:pimeloyl-ACP methyl ester carboxylesterase
MRDEMLAAGYAVVASSYSENGYAVKEATIQSHQLRGVFVSNVGEPRHTYLVGASLGGIVGALLTERYPGQYDGSLLISGVVGGSDDELTYVGDIRVLFDVAYPGVLPGSLLRVPVDVNVQQEIQEAQAAIQADPAKLGIIAGLARVKPEYTSTAELVQSILTAIGFQLQGANDLLDRTHGHTFFENRHWTYSGPVPQSLADYVNATVARYSASADARAYVEQYGEPSGDIQVPVITLHNRWDPVVPFAHEALYASAVAARGRGSLLLQRAVPRYGHVAVQPSEMIASLGDLAGWVETGTKPAN